MLSSYRSQPYLIRRNVEMKSVTPSPGAYLRRQNFKFECYILEYVHIPSNQHTYIAVYMRPVNVGEFTQRARMAFDAPSPKRALNYNRQRWVCGTKGCVPLGLMRARGFKVRRDMIPRYVYIRDVQVDARVRRRRRCVPDHGDGTTRYQVWRRDRS